MSDARSKQVKLIIECAVELFRKNGYENVSVNDICAAAGIARSTFYLYFSCKKQVIEKMLADVHLNKDEYFSDFISAKNDFERMWILCRRYLDVAETMGPEVTGALLRLDLLGEVDILTQVHSVDEWFIRMCANCLQSGVMQSREPAETLATLGVDIAFYTTYEWCRANGAFRLKELVRRRAESVYGVAEEMKMSEDELKKL